MNSIGFNLWRGQTQQWRVFAILRAVLGLIFFGFNYLVQKAILDFVMQTAFSSSIVLVLTGESKRGRTWAAIGIYVIGYLGLLASSFA